MNSMALKMRKMSSDGSEIDMDGEIEFDGSKAVKRDNPRNILRRIR